MIEKYRDLLQKEEELLIGIMQSGNIDEIHMWADEARMYIKEMEEMTVELSSRIESVKGALGGI